MSLLSGLGEQPSSSWHDRWCVLEVERRVWHQEFEPYRWQSELGGELVQRLERERRQEERGYVSRQEEREQRGGHMR